MQHILITGSNRGIGLALVKEYLSRGDVQIFATCRNPDKAEELQQLTQSEPVIIIPLEINDEDSIAASVDLVKQHTETLDLLINNAGIYLQIPESRDLGQLNADSISQVVTTNSVSPVIVTQAYIDMLKKGNNPRIVMISSKMGSMTHAGGNSIAYRMSKASMNMAAKALSLTLESEGITVITTHPGHVATDMGGDAAPVTPAQSAAGLVKIIENLSASDTGKFFNYTGEEIAW
jgi:NAD(P)-dependent dehydrogenase (short-subunit alcohol dehydrogenase family)